MAPDNSRRHVERADARPTSEDEQVKSVALYSPASGSVDDPHSRMPSSGVSPDDDVFNKLLKNRIVILGSVVDDAIANKICAQLLLLAAEDPEREIYMHINSPGGSVDAGMAIYDTMQYVPCDVATVGMGLAASMGQFLLCAGERGKRYALPHARIMMHQPLGGIGGSASLIAIQAEQMLYTKKKLQELTAQHTGQTVDQIERDSDRERWFSADEAKDYGFVDHVVRSARQVPTETTAVS
jgi:ATP-dependent Clp protease, protease subunit